MSDQTASVVALAIVTVGIAIPAIVLGIMALAKGRGMHGRVSRDNGVDLRIEGEAPSQLPPPDQTQRLPPPPKEDAA
jgi:hypothetical protein